MPKPTRAALLKLLILGSVVAAAFLIARGLGLFAYRDLGILAESVRSIREHPAAAPLFVVAYVVATAFALPGSVLTLAGGAMFGFTGGVLLNWLGATLGATAAYSLARVLGEDAVRSLLGKHAAALDKLTGTRGFMTLFRLRLIPIVPFNALNFGAGLAGVKTRPYVTATALGIIPGTAVYTYFADALLSGAEGAQEKAFIRVAIAGGLLVLLSFVPTIARRFGWIPKISATTLALSVTHHVAMAETQTFDRASCVALLRRDIGGGIVNQALLFSSPTAKAHRDPVTKPFS